MYHYSVDQAVIYTSEDIVLFRESPFASWMERLTLENPGHGIPPDVGSCPPSDKLEAQDELATTLRDEGKNVISIEWQTDEAVRRTATLAAMRHGIDFIVNGQIFVGPMADSATLLMRTSGYSELGNYLYIPCDTQIKTTLSSTFRLCFLADLLHSLQGQLPPQMLILRGNSDVVPLKTEDHIYHYRAVKQRFMSAQSSFRKHQMPNPVESSHFGRWSDCANELLRQRALGQEEPQEVEEGQTQPEDEEVLPEEEWSGDVRTGTLLVSRNATGASLASAYDMDTVAGAVSAQESSVSIQCAAGTLAEQARMLSPDQPTVSAGDEITDTLQNLEFIGSSQHLPTIGEPLKPVEPRTIEPRTVAPSPLAPRITEPSPVAVSPQWQPGEYGDPPPANLRNPANVDMDAVQDTGRRLDKKADHEIFSNSLITNRDA